MATKTQDAKYNRVVQTAGRNIRPIQAFFTKFTNDWSLNLSAALAYNLLMAVFPLVIALFSILGLVIGTLSPSTYDQVKNQLLHALPTVTSASSLLDAAFKQLVKNAGFLGTIAIILALFNGSRLFILIEGCFDIIYHVRPRPFIPQNAMAFAMLLLFIILIPIMVVAAAGPALIFSVLQNTPIGQIPGIKTIFSLGGILGGLIAAYILFQAIYIVVPNQKISFRNSWLGAVIAAILLEAYLILFPLYVARFLTSYAGQTLGIVILLVFFYYFAIILFLGAEVNAFFAEGVTVTPQDLVTLVHTMTSHLATSEQAVKQEAAPLQRNVPPKEIVPQNEETSRTRAQSQNAAMLADTTARTQDQSQHASRKFRILPGRKAHKSEELQRQPGTSRVWTVFEVTVGTLLAFLVELVRSRRRTN